MTMNVTAVNPPVIFPMRKTGAIPAILSGGLIAGTLDLTYAVLFCAWRGIKPIRVPQAIASGLLGVKSFQEGIPAATLGVALHFLVAVTAAAVYYGASRKLKLLTREAVLCGMLYGMAIYFFMNFVVLPLSAAPKFRSTPLSIACDFVVHMLFIGLPIALAVRCYSERPSGRATAKSSPRVAQ
jgi:hypothetical protein